MVDLSANLVKVEIVDCPFNGSEEDDNDYEIGMACYNNADQGRKRKSTSETSKDHDGRPEKTHKIRATFSRSYSSKYAVRMRATAQGRLCAERLIENNRIHDVDGHVVLGLEKNRISSPVTPDSETGKASPQQRTEYTPRTDEPRTQESDQSQGEFQNLDDPALVGAIVVTFTEIRNIHYYSAPKADTHLLHEALVARAERTMGSAALAYRIPLEQLVDCGNGSMSFDFVHENRHPFATFQFCSKALDEEGKDVLNKREDVMSKADLQTLVGQSKTQIEQSGGTVSKVEKMLLDSEPRKDSRSELSRNGRQL